MPCVNEVKTLINLADLVIDDLNNTTDDLLYSCFIFECKWSVSAVEERSISPSFSL